MDVREGFGAQRVVERYDGAVVEPGRVLGENHLRTVLEEVAHRSHLLLDRTIEKIREFHRYASPYRQWWRADHDEQWQPRTTS